MLRVELIPIGSVDLWDDLRQIASHLNSCQSAIAFVPGDAAAARPLALRKRDQYVTTDVFAWLREYLAATGEPKGRHVIGYLDSPLRSERLRNLFGSRDEKPNDVACVTFDSFNDYASSRIAYGAYYALRYALSFIAPDIMAHDEERGCFFERRMNKKSLISAIEAVRLCDECHRRFLPHLTDELEIAISSLQQMVRKLGDRAFALPDTLILKGGGVKGLAFAGALKELGSLYKFETFVGTSAGAITAALLAAGYSPDELLVEMRSMNFSGFLDGMPRRLINAVWHGGLHSGDPITAWIHEKLRARTKHRDSPLPVQFEELDNRLVVFAANEIEGTVLFDSRQRPDEDAEFAVRCSMSIPLFFVARENGGYLMYDGGLLNNYPVDRYLVSEPDARFLALYLASNPPKPGRKGWQLKRIYDILVNRDEYAVVRRHIGRTILIKPDPVRTTDFTLSEIEKEWLVQCGAFAARHFLAREGHSVQTPDDVAKAESEYRKETLPKVLKARRKRTIKTWIVRLLALAGAMALWHFRFIILSKLLGSP